MINLVDARKIVVDALYDSETAPPSSIRLIKKSNVAAAFEVSFHQLGQPDSSFVVTIENKK